MSDPRTARCIVSGIVNLTQNNTDFTFTEHASGKADDMSVTVYNPDINAGDPQAQPDRIYLGGILPRKGSMLKSKIICRNWRTDGDTIILKCGQFSVDEVEYSGSASGGDKVSIKAVSADLASSVRMEAKNTAWEQTSLRTVASDIAGRNGFGLVYNAPDVQFDRVDQRQESDLKFLQRLAEKYGIDVKTAQNKIILFDGQGADAQSPVKTYRRGTHEVECYTLRDQGTDVYRACEAAYWDPVKKQEIKKTFMAIPPVDTGQVLKINLRNQSLAEAEKIARSALRRENKKQHEGTLDLMGQPDIYAGQVIGLEGWQNFDGNWYIESATHKISRSGGYKTSFTIRKTLEY